MTRPFTVLKSVGPKLVPFFKTVTIYFVLFGSSSSLDSIFYCVIKILPVISLVFFVLLHGMSFSQAYSYSRKIVIGLLFSCLGDAFLVWKSAGYFKHGMLSFAIAQAAYASAFGFEPLNLPAGAVLYTNAAMIFYYLLPGLKGSMVFLTGIYVALITLMAWRAVARVQLFDDLWTWTKLCGCAGAVCFLVSDTVIAAHAFRQEVPYAHQIIMVTYYAAQLGISLSVVDSHVDAVIEMSKTTARKEWMKNAYLEAQRSEEAQKSEKVKKCMEVQKKSLTFSVAKVAT